MGRFIKQNFWVGIFSITILFLTKSLHSNIPGHSLWRALGDTSFILLAITLVIGPLSKIWTQMGKLIPWRRTFGVWFFITALFHTLLIFNGWLEGDLMKFLGYTLRKGEYILTQPGFALANLLGLAALIFALILTITSFDRSIKSLGYPSWKWIQNFIYVIFYLTIFHIIYFMFFHFANKRDLVSWFSGTSLIIIFIVIFLQIIAFSKIVTRKNKLKKVKS